tara:strand:- start:3149 stop:3463 length:315 start_codon:yes stop_codon:yes gene_type:complete
MSISKIAVGRVSRNVGSMVNIKVDRTSVLGNPFFMENESLRDDVCVKYQAFFDKEIVKKGSNIHKEVTHIYKLAKAGKLINLQCHCYPKRCHANTIKNFIDSHL